jgi:hypothetical protein
MHSGGSRNFVGGALQKGVPTPKITEKIRYLGSQILSFTNNIWLGEKGGPDPLQIRH